MRFCICDSNYDIEFKHLSNPNNLSLEEANALFNNIKNFDVKESVLAILKHTTFNTEYNLDDLRDSYSHIAKNSEEQFPFRIKRVGLVSTSNEVFYFIASAIQEIQKEYFKISTKINNDDKLFSAKDLLELREIEIPKTVSEILTRFSSYIKERYCGSNDLIYSIDKIVNPFITDSYYDECGNLVVKKYKAPFDSYLFSNLIVNHENTIMDSIFNRFDELDWSIDLGTIFNNTGIFDDILNHKLNPSCVVYGKLAVLLRFIATKTICTVLNNLVDVCEVASGIYEDITNRESSIQTIYVPDGIEYESWCTFSDKPGISTETISGTKFSYTGQKNDADNAMNINKVDENYKSKTLKLRKTFIDAFKIKPAQKKMLRRAKFFRKYFGRIPGLYKRYGGTSKVFENDFIEDPVIVLGTTAVKYIQNMTKFADDQFKMLINTAKKVSSASDVEMKFQALKGYCKKYPIDRNDDPKQIKQQILNETTWRIAHSICNHEIYGFSVEGIVQNRKFPPANHIVTSLFLENQHEQPTEKSVNEIFKSPESLLVFGKPENIIKFDNLYKSASGKVLSSYNDKETSAAIKLVRNSTNSFIRNSNRDVAFAAKDQLDMDPKLQKSLCKAIETGVVEAIDMTIEQKNRVMQCLGCTHNMLSRVTDLAKNCVLAMLQAEAAATDKNGRREAYNSGRLKTKDTGKLNAMRRHVEGRNQLEQARYNNNVNKARNFFEM